MSLWSRQRESNSQPAEYESGALPIELCRHEKWWRGRDLNPRSPAYEAGVLPLHYPAMEGTEGLEPSTE